MKPKAKKKVQKLRKEGLSYSEILEEISVSKGTISRWCQDIKLTPKQQARLDNKKREGATKGPKLISRRRKEEINKIKEKAKEEIEPPSLYEQKIIGAMLYRAEGDKSNGTAIRNSDPALIEFMAKWLEQVNESSSQKLKAQLNLHKDQKENKIKEYWADLINISLKQFNKTYIKPEGTGHRKNILSKGAIKIRIGGEDLRHRLMAWSEVILQNL